MNNQKKSHVILAMALTAAIAVLVLFGATFVLLQLKFKDPIEFSISDWLQIALPIVGGAIVVIFAFLGVNRLKDYDERQDKLAKELREDMNARVDSTLKLAEPRLNDTYKEWSQSLDTKLQVYNSRFSEIESTIKKYDEVFGSVAQLEEAVDAVGNVDEAHNFVVKLYSDDDSDKTQRTRILLALVRRVANGEIKGDSNDYHNFASELARQNYYEHAADVVYHGLEIFPENIDLLSDSIRFSHKAGRDEQVNKGMEKLDGIDKDIWNWRAFTFYIDTLNDRKADSNNRERALNCVNEYKRVLPSDERAYMAEYETFKKYGDLEYAEAALTTAESQLAMTAQCSLTLSEIYHMRGDYDKAIYSANRALIGQAETQPSSNTGAAFAHRALAGDAKINKCLLEGSDIQAQMDKILSAIDDYKMAISCGYSHGNFKVRIKILESLLPIESRHVESSDMQERLDRLEHLVGAIVASFQNHGEEVD